MPDLQLGPESVQMEFRRFLQEAELLPIASRIRARLRTEALDPSQLLQSVDHLPKMGGNPKLMKPPAFADAVRTCCRQSAPAHEHGQ